MNLTAVMFYDELVAKCKQGDVQSYETLYNQYARSMFNTSLRIVNNASDAEDVLQESFAAAFQYLDQFDYSSTFGAWLKRIVVNKSINALRQRKVTLIDIDETSSPEIQEAEEPDEEMIQLKVEEIRKAIRLLPNGYRTVLSLFLFEGYDYDEIGEILQIASSTVRTQYHRGKQKLLHMVKTRRFVMNDKLKQFIEINRDAFDNETPSPELFKKLKKEIVADDKSKKLFIVKPLFRAAVVAGLILLSSLFYFILQTNDDKKIIAMEDVNSKETGIPDANYAKQIWHFKELIGLKQAELKLIEKEQPELYYQFIGDINKLDSTYRILKTKLDETPNTEMLLEAMIQNLQLQSDLLNQQLIIIKKIKQKSKAHEKNAV